VQGHRAGARRQGRDEGGRQALWRAHWQVLEGGRLVFCRRHGEQGEGVTQVFPREVADLSIKPPRGFFIQSGL
jgi:hypothetical protein